MKPLVKSALIFFALASFLGALFLFLGPAKVWDLWMVPQMSPAFADLRTITHGGESVKMGLDPMKENPGDPWNRPLNYPRVWQLLYTFGVSSADTLWIGFTIALLYLLGVAIFLGTADLPTISFSLLFVLSPPAMLGLERGNIDLLMFFLVSMAVVLWQKHHVVAGILMLSTAVLKLFPVAAIGVFFGGKKPRVTVVGIVLLVVFLSYCIVTLADLQLISEGTPRSIRLSFGMNVIWMAIDYKYGSLPGTMIRVLTYLVVIAVIAGSLLLPKNKVERESPEYRAIPMEVGFNVGALIFIATYLLGNNYDYRMIFLTFVAPQLIFWIRGTSRYRPILCGIILFSCVFTLWSDLFRSSVALVVLAEIANWIIFSGLLFIIIRSSFWDSLRSLGISTGTIDRQR